nr:TraB/GumN family protein [uncultured Devosia sp.]
MKSTFRPLPAALLVSLCLMAAPVLAAPAMWEVRDDDSSIWLFGSFHVLPEGTIWRTAMFDDILGDADRVVFEADVRPAALALIGADAFVRGIYVDGTLLTDVLSDAEEARLRAEAEAIGLPIGTILAMRPWMATNTISVQALAGEGYTAQGVEVILQPELSDDRQAYLETGEQQLDVLAGAPEDEQVAMLLGLLDQIPIMPKLMDKMLDSWLEGTPDAMEALFLAEMGGFETTFLDRLIYARNQNWISPLETMLADDQDNLVIVGAAHLLGDGSVLDLLDRAGYEIERVQ